MGLSDRPNDGCSLRQLVDRLRPIELQVLFEPPGDPVTVRGIVMDDQGDPLPELPGGLLSLVGAAADPERVHSSLRRAAARHYGAVLIKPRGLELGPLLRTASELGVAVLSISDDLPWGRISALLDAALAPFVGDADSPPAAIGEELFAIADAVAGTVGGSVAIEDLGQHVLAYSSVPGQRIDPLRSQGILERRVPDLPVNSEMYREVLAARGILRYPTVGDELARAAIAIRAGNLPLGTMWVIEGEDGLTNEARRGMEEAAQLAALHMLRARSAAELDQHLRGELLRSLLEGNTGSQSAAQRLGQPTGQRQALLALGNHGSDQTIAPPLIAHVGQEVGRFCAALHPDAVVATVGRAAYVLLASPHAPDAAARLAATLLPMLDRAVGGRICVGISSNQAAGADLVAMRAEADDVLRAIAADETGSRRVAVMSDVRSDVLLMHLRDELQRNPQLRQPAVADLLAADRRRGDEVLDSLRAWFNSRFDIRGAAQQLHIHPNTLRYRLRRFASQTGIDLGDPDQCLCLWLQLRCDKRKPGDS